MNNSTEQRDAACDGHLKDRRRAGTVSTASVRVMRSHDYCHFEIVLGVSATYCEYDMDAVDNLRKQAARLADKAVEQYKIKKASLQDGEDDEDTIAHYREDAERIEAKPEADRSPDEKALLKGVKDALFRAQRGEYDYQDQWDD